MGHKHTLNTRAELSNLAQIRRFVQDVASENGADGAAIRKALLAVDEAATNVALHGYGGQGGPLDVEVECDEETMTIRLRDAATPFDPHGRTPPDINLPLEERPVGGLGVFLICQNMDQVLHRVTESGGNELTLIRRLRESSP